MLGKFSEECALANLPKAANLCLLGPHIGVETTREIVIQDGAVLVVHDGRETIVNQEAGDGETSQQTQDGDDGHPLLLGVLL